MLTTSYPRTATDPAGSFVAGFSRWMARQGATVEVIAAGPGARRDGPIPIERVASRLFYGGGAPEALEASRRAWLAAPWFMARFAAALARRAHRWDALVSHWLLPSGLLGAQVAAGRPHVAIAHAGDVALLERVPAGRALAGRIARSARLVFVSRALRARFAALTGVEQGQVVPMGIDAGPPLPEPTGPFTVLYLGRLVPIKGVDRLLLAASRLPAVRFIIAGDGPEAARLRRAAPGNVRFTGVVAGAEKRDLLAAAHLLCVPSVELPSGRTEGTPTVVAEAHGAGRPVLASATGGLPEAVGEAGLLVPPGDTAALTATLEALARDRARLRALAAAARDRAAEADWSVVGPALLGGPLSMRIGEEIQAELPRRPKPR